LSGAGRILALSLLAAAASGCGGTPPPAVETTPADKPYKHTEAFMWEQVKATLARRWHIATEDKELRQIVTDWDTQLSPMDRFGRRTRITINLEGSDGEGWSVRASEEAQQNTEQVNPLSPEEADWETVASEGALASQFLVDLDRRIHPPQPWKDREVR
jgi:hypothetical protein